MPPIPPKPRLSDNPIYLLAMALGGIAFVVGGVVSLILYSLGGADLALVGVILGVLVFAIGYNALLSLRDRDGCEP